MGFRHTNRNPFLANLNTILGVKFDVPSIPKVNPAVIPALFLRISLRDFFFFIFDSPLSNLTPTVLEHLFNKIVPNQVLLHLTFQFPRPYHPVTLGALSWWMAMESRGQAAIR
jgi:hypothetical protein